tara:strand:+ start:1361 stop:1621 length:261 start_codon:yes stop_codon:yes gene_type:complete
MYKKDFKVKVVQEAIGKKNTIPEIAQSYNIALSTIYRWLKEIDHCSLKHRSINTNASFNNEIKRLKQEKKVLLQAFAICIKEKIDF